MMDINALKILMEKYWMEKEKYNDEHDGGMFSDDYLCGLYDMLCFVVRITDEEIDRMAEYYGEDIEE